MAYMESITVAGDRQSTVVEALRCYAKARRELRPVLPDLVAIAGRSGLAAPAMVALGSVFELTEGCLGRSLATGGPGRLSRDERAVLRLLDCADMADPASGSAAVPHGLPGVLIWAIRSARRLWPGARPAPPRAAGATCPFDTIALSTPNEGR